MLLTRSNAFEQYNHRGETEMADAKAVKKVSNLDQLLALYFFLKKRVNSYLGNEYNDITQHPRDHQSEMRIVLLYQQLHSLMRSLAQQMQNQGKKEEKKEAEDFVTSVYSLLNHLRLKGDATDYLMIEFEACEDTINNPESFNKKKTAAKEAVGKAQKAFTEAKSETAKTALASALRDFGDLITIERASSLVAEIRAKGVPGISSFYDGLKNEKNAATVEMQKKFNQIPALTDEQEAQIKNINRLYTHYNPQPKKDETVAERMQTLASAELPPVDQKQLDEALTFLDGAISRLSSLGEKLSFLETFDSPNFPSSIPLEVRKRAAALMVVDITTEFDFKLDRKEQEAQLRAAAASGMRGMGTLADLAAAGDRGGAKLVAMVNAVEQKMKVTDSTSLDIKTTMRKMDEDPDLDAKMEKFKHELHDLAVTQHKDECKNLAADELTTLNANYAKVLGGTVPFVYKFTRVYLDANTLRFDVETADWGNAQQLLKLLNNLYMAAGSTPKQIYDPNQGAASGANITGTIALAFPNAAKAQEIFTRIQNQTQAFQKEASALQSGSASIPNSFQSLT